MGLLAGLLARDGPAHPAGATLGWQYQECCRGHAPCILTLKCGLLPHDKCLSCTRRVNACLGLWRVVSHVEVPSPAMKPKQKSYRRRIAAADVVLSTARCTRSPQTAAMWRRRRARWCGTTAMQTRTSATGRCRPWLLHVSGLHARPRSLAQELSCLLRMGMPGGLMNARFVLLSLCLPGLYATGLPGWTLRPAGGCASPHDRRAEHNDDGSRGSFAIWLLPVSRDFSQGSSQSSTIPRRPSSCWTTWRACSATSRWRWWRAVCRVM